MGYAQPSGPSNLCSTINMDDVNITWNQWKDAFLNAVQDYIPTKNIKGHNNPPWINGDIVHALRKKESTRQKFFSSPTDSLRAYLREL